MGSVPCGRARRAGGGVARAGTRRAKRYGRVARIRARGGDDARAGGVRARGEWFKLSNELERCAPAAAAAVHDEDVAAAVLDADGASASTDGAGGDARGGVRDGGRDERGEDGAAASSSGRGGGGDGESGRAVRGQDVKKGESG